jgi:hypothetical protein
MRRRAGEHVVDHDCGDRGDKAERGREQRFGNAGRHHAVVGVAFRCATLTSRPSQQPGNAIVGTGVAGTMAPLEARLAGVAVDQYYLSRC